MTISSMSGVLSVASRSLRKSSIRGFKSTAPVKGAGGMFLYRRGPPPTGKITERWMIGINGFLWWWIFHHAITQPEGIIGHNQNLYPSSWTDEELGIPPDDE